MRLYNSLIKPDSYTTKIKKGLTCWLQLSTRSNDCCQSIFFLPWMVLPDRVSTNRSCKNCEPIDLSRFVADLRERHLEYWTLYYDTHPREHNSKRFPYHQWCALPTRRALVTHSLYLRDFPSTCFSTCLVMSSVVQLVSYFVFTPYYYVLRQQHWIKEKKTYQAVKATPHIN